MDNKFMQAKFFKNCLSIKRTEEGIIPLRFTEKQLTAYEGVPVRKLRSLCPSGICFELMTDADSIKINYTVKGHARDWDYFDLWVNDEMVDCIGARPIQGVQKEVCFTIPASADPLKKVTLYLPHVAELVITDIELPGNAAAEPTEAFSKNLLCLGDSITQGMDALHPSGTYPALLSRWFGMNLLNQGVGGYVFNADSLDLNLPYQPDMITVAYGTNDWGSCASPEEFRENCSKFLADLTAQFADVRIFVITPFWRKDLNETRNSGSFFDICNTIVELCGSYPAITVIDGMKAIPHMSEYFGDQKLHPTDAGFQHIAAFIAKSILLSRARGGE